MSLFKKTGLKHKLYSLNVFYLILLVIVGLFYVNYNGLIAELSSKQQKAGVMTENTRKAAFVAKDYLAGRVSFSNLEDAFQPYLRAQGEDGGEQHADAIWNDLQRIHEIRRKNAAIEAEIAELMDHSINQSNGYIEQVSKKLADSETRHDVSQLERLVIMGASVNTTSSFKLRLLFNRLKENLDAKDRMFAFLETLLANVENDLKRLSGTPFENMAQEAKKANLRVKELTQSFIDNTRQVNVLQGQIFQGLEQAMSAIRAMETETSRTFIDRVKGYFQTIVVVLLITSVLGVGLSLLLARRLSNSLERIIGNLSEASTQITSAAEQVSASGQSLAEGASEQAASIEETSSSLEEISSMTRQNAENTRETNRVMMDEAAPNFQNIGERMDKMKEAIDKTVANSEETAKIVKTIDEIAFQTNLLALNAAVEAARAGEAGAGFAVVADEVRNLAMRAAEAAKNTSELIHTSNDRIKEAAELNQQVVQALGANSEIAGKVGKLISEVAAASEEQTHGIDQISKAVAEMDKVTQQTAANAEESASASEEMSAQTKEMNQVVEDLVALTGIREETGKVHRAYGRTESTDQPHAKAVEVASFAAPVPKQQCTGDQAEIRPDQVIPFEDEKGRE